MITPDQLNKDRYDLATRSGLWADAYFGLLLAGAFGLAVLAGAVLYRISLTVAPWLRFSVITDMRADRTFVVPLSQNVLHGPLGSLNTAPHAALHAMVQLVCPGAVQVDA